MTTKVHAVTDGLGNPLRFLLSSGNRNDICMAQALLEPFDLSGRLILADKGYDSDKFVHWIEERGGIVVIPSRICAKRPRNTDWHTYKERHLVENLFLKLKNYRRFATRYEKKALYFLSCGCLPCVYPCLVTLIVLKQTLGSRTLHFSYSLNLSAYSSNEQNTDQKRRPKEPTRQDREAGRKKRARPRRSGTPR